MNCWANLLMCQRRKNPRRAQYLPRKSLMIFPSTKVALDRVRSLLRRDALKARETTTKMSLTNDKKHVSTDEKKIME